MYSNDSALRSTGFDGFMSVSELRVNPSCIPDEKGIYVVLNPDVVRCDFLPKGSGGYFKEKNPNVSVDTLCSKWVNDCLLLYIGQAGGNGSSATLRKRLRQLFDFGQGKPVGHYGGRYLWQVKHHPELIVAWKKTGLKDPREAEKELMSEFIRYYGRLPFANLVK